MADFVGPLGLALAAAAGLAGGTMNALAGGGTFATMPALIACGLPSPIANATSNVALQPGAIASAWAYRDGLRPLGGMRVRTLTAITLFGGTVGSLLLVATPTRTFDVVVPWLLLAAFLVLAFGRHASAALHRRVEVQPGAIAWAQLALGVYGGYFGGGVGLMMTAAWGLLAGEAPHEVAAPRTLMLATANAAAMVVFVLFGMVGWLLVVPMLLGAVAGGYLGARLGRMLSPLIIRIVTLCVTATMTVVFFVRAYA